MTATDSVHYGEHVDLAAPGSMIGRVDVIDDLALAEPIWRRLEQLQSITSPYQNFDLLAGWQRTVGVATDVTPFIVAGFDTAGAPAFLCPLGVWRKGPLKVAGYLGGKHANFNFPLCRPDIFPAMTPESVHDILDRVARMQEAPDLFALFMQPHSWNGFRNPFTFLPHQESPSHSARLTIDGSGEDVLNALLKTSMRARLRTKERKLQKLPGYRYMRATTPADVDRMLQAFFRLKAAHMQAQGLPNIFASPGQEAFITRACHTGLANNRPLIEIHALECDGEILAMFAGVNDGERVSCMFNTYTLSENGRQSPGLILLIHIIRNLAERGLTSFDLGVGEAHYKQFFCKEPEPLFDSFLPLTAMGRLAAASLRLGFRMKGYVKRNPLLLDLAHRARRGLSSAPQTRNSTSD